MIYSAAVDFRLMLMDLFYSTWRRRWAERKERSSTLISWIWRGWVVYFHLGCVRGAPLTFSRDSFVRTSRKRET